MEKNIEKTFLFFEDWKELIEDFEKFSKSEDNPYFKSKYVPLKAILPVVKEKCHKHNFVFMQFPYFQEGTTAIETKFIHISGHTFSGWLPLVAKDPNDPQKLGASITYMRRYSLTCMLGLEEDDDDGNTAADKMPFEKQCELAKQGKLMCFDCGSDIEYYETKTGEARLKCPKDWKHKNFVSKDKINAEANKIANVPF